MGGYAPASGGHAIEQAVIGVRVFKAPEPAAYERAVTIAAALAEKDGRLPGRLQLDPMSMVFGRQVITHGYVAQAELAPGMLFQRVKPNGSTEAELTIEQTAVTYRTNAYKRWSDMQTLLREVLCPVAEALAAGDLSNISVIELRCIDRFNQAESGELPALSALVRNDTGIIPTSLVSKSELLHTHSGWFEHQSDDGRVLVNVNVDVVDAQDGRRTATILQVVSSQASGTGQHFEDKGSFTASVMEAFDVLHRRDKKLLAEILTDQVQREIDLTGKSGIG